MAENLYNYQEFIRLSKEGKIGYKEVEVPKNASLLTQQADVSKHIYLIVDGYISIFSKETTSNSKIYSIQGKGSFLNYLTLLDDTPNQFTFKTLSKCTLYQYSKQNIQYFLSMFPENFGFQFFIMKNQAIHAYRKSIVMNCSASDKLMAALTSMALFHGIPVDDDKVILPPEIKTSYLLSYCNLSKSCFYKDLQDSNYIKKQNKNWVVFSKELNNRVKVFRETW
ncbi:Crp/Fnr family transcriptional regulator [Listeria ivanovii]|uniref:Crp/Fnr family transcriptional regulator n=1 Tax=Listeria ivanovii TaxID=1638 RepID=UPI0003ECA17D|nr:Crp/Fnr family transcriptional regulator [Listeria ivanovii]AHI54741.1 cyclic nucleotide-binding protein [Listeria ivanovii WSLC3009]AIS64208.1 cyclic nucleotide-binding protein [Listeria ivanovii subsp. ivanovii]MBK3915489.1 Crp/Fnr family transcriptional regulator [Listeria ivanovii subsp. ivanovii]MBK3922685.1 Crp/Fnr family transcriptional regulator [Listeria ivanovii subsp. ivanovii]MBK3927777.1 Crp/Fnr family transcriptional regulator [Listeria ivanovii subsp. ivanovii]